MCNTNIEKKGSVKIRYKATGFLFVMYIDVHYTLVCVSKPITGMI